MVRLPGSHSPNVKNRSSKHLCWLTKIKPIFRSMSGEELKTFSANPDAVKEMNRRDKKRSKRS